MASRWANDTADKEEELRRKKEKEEKKRQKLQKQQEAEAAAAAAAAAAQATESRPSKRQRLSSDDDNIAQNPAKTNDPQPERKLLRFDGGTWGPSRQSLNFENLNHIEEGSYGWVSRARDTTTGEIVALKKVKMDYNEDGFPISALREISILQRARHKNIVSLKEILQGSAPQECLLVLEFVEHDLRTLQEDMSERFLASEVKTLLRQLVGAVSFLHDNAIMHRDLKTSNILLNNRGQLKLADFGMARHIPPPDAHLTQLVVTLWYRAPELLLGASTYGTEVDMWSVGCVFGELLAKQPILQGKNEVEQLSLIFGLCGMPSESSWPGFYRLPNARSLRLPRNNDGGAGFNRTKFPLTTAAGIDLLSSLLALNPEKRLSATEVLSHRYFAENPKPLPEAMFPTFPSKAGQEKRRRRESPAAPRRGEAVRGLGNVDFSGLFAGRENEEKGAGFQLKVA